MHNVQRVRISARSYALIVAATRAERFNDSDVRPCEGGVEVSIRDSTVEALTSLCPDLDQAIQTAFALWGSDLPSLH